MLVDEEHHLERKASPGQPLSDDDEARLPQLEVHLDQCWDLLRQRRARRDRRGLPAVTGAPTAWPALPLAEWAPTRDTLQLLTQIVGKVRLARTPKMSHWWNVTLYVTARV